MEVVGETGFGMGERGEGLEIGKGGGGGMGSGGEILNGILVGAGLAVEALALLRWLVGRLIDDWRSEVDSYLVGRGSNGYKGS